MRFYTTELEIAALAGDANDGILIIEAPSDLIVLVIRAAVYNLDNDIHEMLHMEFVPVTTKGPLAGASTPAIRKHDNGDIASSVTTYGAGNNGMTTEPTAWGDPYDAQGYSNLQGYEFDPPLVGLNAGPIISPSGLVGIRMPTIPGTAYLAKALITFAEMGG